MNFTETPIEGLVIVEPKVFTDSRGCFFESFSLREFRRATGLHYIDFVQDNESHSSRGVIRGLHFQRGEHAQAKLVRVTTGAVLDVAVDLRDGSPTYGRHFAVELSAENKRQLFLPRGFAHGFSVLSDEAVLQYKVDNYYCPEAEGGISPSDPTLAIDWRVDPATAILSPKDLSLPLFK
ncbi:MAG: dTDP-4-dehydrorhamnose 3,5-epimerase [Muribaculaceae bacterium]|nr:dTDP-4-dehydrorhamnose 3,5-epimerase [Muribaculaceae bacterium]MDE5971481.1 dTDP-4-dehydrorhamnose 3,5-epimerase [Muribaculaceae bacterium]MDE6461555.1 dTDP-4-dehydrorhamnose 3,5-epimerase [Muribaculaceae bacterium]MDE6509003.1 dTDP-4-dehydrorhamnose 3,5-epimerase [Muribaculaceae bacterium]